MRTSTRCRLAFIFLAATTAGFAAQTGETIDYRVLTQIRDEGFNRSQVMDTVSWLADVYGPRMAGSPSHKQAADWAAKKMTAFGFANVHVERWPFGKGWQMN